MPLPQVKSLTIKQMQELRKMGGDVRTNANYNEATEILLNYIISLYPGTEWDNIPYNNAVQFAIDVFKYTITPAAEEETKNL